MNYDVHARAGAGRCAAPVVLLTCLAACHHGSRTTGAVTPSEWEDPVELGVTSSSVALTRTGSGAEAVAFVRGAQVILRSSTDGSWGPEDVAETLPVSDAAIEAVTVRDGGSVLIVYSMRGNPVAFYGALHRDSAGVWERINSPLGTIAGQYEVVARANAEGDLFAAALYQNLLNPAERMVSANRMDATSLQWQPMWLLENGAARDAKGLCVGLGGDRSTLVAWFQRGATEPYWHVQGQFGTGVLEPGEPIWGIDGLPGDIAAAAGFDGHGIVAFVSDSGGTRRIEAVRHLPTHAWEAPKLLATTEAEIGGLQLAAAANDAMYATWVELYPDGTAALVGRAPGLDEWEPRETIAAAARIGDHHLAAGGNGSMHAVWIENATEIRASRRPFGGAWLAPSVLYRAPAGATLAQPRLAVDPLGRASALWIAMNDQATRFVMVTRMR